MTNDKVLPLLVANLFELNELVVDELTSEAEVRNFTFEIKGKKDVPCS
jgi:hypothetical protein